MPSGVLNNNALLPQYQPLVAVGLVDFPPVGVEQVEDAATVRNRHARPHRGTPNTVGNIAGHDLDTPTRTLSTPSAPFYKLNMGRFPYSLAPSVQVVMRPYNHPSSICLKGTLVLTNFRLVFLPDNAASTGGYSNCTQHLPASYDMHMSV
jgi:hypothetical protein